MALSTPTQKRSLTVLLLAVALAAGDRGNAETGTARPAAFKEVVVYSTAEDGSLMHWLGISPLLYNISYLGDSMSADVLAGEGKTQKTVRPRAGDQVQGHTWHKMHFTGAVQGPSMCELFQVAGRGFNYAITCCYAYVYSPVARPKAVFAGSSDDALKVILNGNKVWSNQIQRSPTYDSDQAPAPLKKGWNTLLVVVDQVWGGHLLCARFLDGGQGVTDLEVSLDPPTKSAKRRPAGPYNAAASKLMREADTLKMDGKLTEALAAYEQVIDKYSLADVAPRAAYARAMTYYSLKDEKSLGHPKEAAAALRSLLGRYPQDLLAEYALLDLAGIEETALSKAKDAEATYRSFEELYPRSSLASRSVVQLGRLLAQQRRFEESLLTYRKVLQKYPKSDEVMTATLGIADTYRLAGEDEKARKQYEAARSLAQDWHDNKYGVDVGKQAWLQGVLDEIRKKLEAGGQ